MGRETPSPRSLLNIEEKAVQLASPKSLVKRTPEEIAAIHIALEAKRKEHDLKNAEEKRLERNKQARERRAYAKTHPPKNARDYRA